MTTDARNPERFALAIECSNPSARGADRGEVGLARMDDAGGLAFIGSVGLSQEARGSDGLVAAMNEVCSAHGADPSSIARVVVSIGPGGYTALRISVTVAKILARVNGCRVVAVPSAAVAAVGLLDESKGMGESVDSTSAVIALASKNKEAHCTRLINGELEVLGVIGAEGVAASGAGVVVGDGHLPREMVEAAQHAGMRVEGLSLTARSLLEASVGFGGCFGEIDPTELGVSYAREPDAVTQWRKLHG